MIQFRPFLNIDPPGIAELWCQHAPLRALVQPMSTALLATMVLAKPYFDREGLIVAEEDRRLIGFVHAGFGSSPDGSRLDKCLGVICLLMVAARDDREQIAAELLAQGERYLIDRGAKELMAGGVFPANPFYLGLYGGSHSPGILESDADSCRLFQSAGYQNVATRAILQRRLSDFRPVIDRAQLALRREYLVETQFDPPTKSWWEACTIGPTERTLHRLLTKRGKRECGSVTLWNMEPFFLSWGVRTAGLMDLQIDEDQRRHGLGTLLLGEAFRHTKEQNLTQVEVQVREDNLPALALFRKLGFVPVDRGWELRKKV